jgi:hypothetical protein
MKAGGKPSNRLSQFTLQPTVSQSVSQSVRLGVEPQLELMTRFEILFDSNGSVDVGSPLYREDKSVICQEL